MIMGVVSNLQIQLARIILVHPKCEIIFGTIKFSRFPLIYFTLFYCLPISYHVSNFPIAEVVAIDLFALFLVLFLYISSWLLFCIALFVVIALYRMYRHQLN